MIREFARHRFLQSSHIAACSIAAARRPCRGTHRASKSCFEREEPDIEGLLDQPDEHIVFRAQGPEQSRKRDVDDDQGRSKECDFAAQQAET